MTEKMPALHRAFQSRRVVRAAFVLLAASAIVTQASAVQLVPEAAVRVRANERWQLLVDGKLEQAYQYLSPGYRAVRSLKSYVRPLGAASWNSGEAKRVECNVAGDQCTATVRIETEAFLPGLPANKLDTHVQENWIRQEGGWYLFPAE